MRPLVRPVILAALVVGLSVPATAQRTDVVADTIVYHELGRLRHFLEERMFALAGVSSAEGHRVIARSMEERVGAWRKLMRTTWPESDDGWSSFVMNNALAAAFACSEPGLAASYQVMATQALFTDTEVHRPIPYAALGRMEDVLYALSRTRSPERVGRLRARLSVLFEEVR